MPIPVILSDGKEYQLRFTYNAIRRYETLANEALTASTKKLATGTYSFSMLVNLVWAAMVHYADRSLTTDRVADLLDGTPYERVVEIIDAALQEAFFAPPAGDSKPGEAPGPQ